MAIAEKHVKVTKTETVKLEMTPDEAGVLLSTLYAHVGGPLTTANQPLGQIRVALLKAGVTKVALRNLNDEPDRLHHPPYAIVDRMPVKQSPAAVARCATPGVCQDGTPANPEPYLHF